MRNQANKIAYHDTETYGTEDALLVGRLHCLIDGWQDAIVNWMASGGYTVRPLIPDVESRTLVVWGKQDKLVEHSTAERFREDMQDVVVEYIDNCGHTAHLVSDGHDLLHWCIANCSLGVAYVLQECSETLSKMILDFMAKDP